MTPDDFALLVAQAFGLGIAAGFLMVIATLVYGRTR